MGKSYEELLKESIGFGFIYEEEDSFYNLHLSGATPPYEKLDPEDLHMTELFYFDEMESAEAYLYETKKHNPEFREFLDELVVAPIPHRFVESGFFEPILKFDW